MGGSTGGLRGQKVSPSYDWPVYLVSRYETVSGCGHITYKSRISVLLLSLYVVASNMCQGYQLFSLI